MSDLIQGQFACNQSNLNPTPPTIASATIIAPTTALTFVTGTTQVATITPPMLGFHWVILCFTNGSPGEFLTTGNIKIAYQPIVDRPIILFYDPVSALYWPNAVV